MLGRDVRNLIRRGDEAVDAGNVDDTSALVGDHVAPDGFGRVKDAVEIDRGDEVPLVVGELAEGSDELNARVVDEMVDRTEIGGDRVAHPAQQLGFADVDGVAARFDARLARDTGRGCARFVAVEIEKRQGRARASQFEAGGGSDAAAPAGHDADAA